MSACQEFEDPVEEGELIPRSKILQAEINLSLCSAPIMRVEGPVPVLYSPVF